MRTFEFECDDRYEAEKLASLISGQKDSKVWLAGISAVVGNEIVIQLKDKSSHAVVMINSKEVQRLSQLIRDVLKGNESIHSSDFAASTVRIVLA